MNNRECPTVAVEEQDRQLTAFLTSQIAAILSPALDPRPPCPRCGGVRIHSKGYRKKGGLRIPLFGCKTCGRTFSRTFGTPLCEKQLRNLDLFVSLLSQPISFLRAGQLIGSTPDDIKQRVMAFRTWMLDLDPGGEWERRVRLGGRIGEISPAPLEFEELGEREDLELTARLTQAFDDLHSQSHQIPHCPVCSSSNVRFESHEPPRFPVFRCKTCRRKFTRRRGTPFVNTKVESLDRIRELIRYLTLPLPILQVAERVGTSSEMVEKWRDMLAEFADQIVPGASLSSRIRLGVKPAATTPCPFCGRIGTAKRQGDRNWTCGGCGRLFSMRRKVIEREGRLEIVGASVGNCNANP